MYTKEPFTPKPFYEKEKRAWNIGHFPIGTVAKARLFDNVEFEFTVTDHIKNGPKSFVLVTDQPDPHHVSEFNSFNMSWVTSIVKRGKGKTYNNTGAEGFIRNFYEHFQYDYTPAHVLVCYKIIPYLKSDMLVNVDKLVDELYHQGVLRSERGLCKIRYNKKRLNNAIKRLINKFLVRHKAAEREEQAAYNKMYEEDWSSNYDRQTGFPPESLMSLGDVDDLRDGSVYDQLENDLDNRIDSDLHRGEVKTNAFGSISETLRLAMKSGLTQQEQSGDFGVSDENWKAKENDDQLYVNTPDLESVLNKQEYLHDPVPRTLPIRSVGENEINLDAFYFAQRLSKLDPVPNSKIEI